MYKLNPLWVVSLSLLLSCLPIFGQLPVNFTDQPDSIIFQDAEALIFAQTEPSPLNLGYVLQQIDYPQALRKAQVEEIVVARVKVNETGIPQASFFLGRPHPGLAKQVAMHLAELRFIPAFGGGKPMSFWVNVPFNFTLAFPMPHPGPPNLGTRSYNYFTPGVALLREGNGQEAALWFEREVRNLPESPASNMGLAMSYVLLKRYDSAQDHIKQALRYGKRASATDLQAEVWMICEQLLSLGVSVPETETTLVKQMDKLRDFACLGSL